jgi:bisphosphoglycerate-independent phosphoglycerate mutase (AlkP superfamily)
MTCSFTFVKDVVVDSEGKEGEEGALCNVAPAVLAIMGLEKPKGVLVSSPSC